MILEVSNEGHAPVYTGAGLKQAVPIHLKPVIGVAVPVEVQFGLVFLLGKLLYFEIENVYNLMMKLLDVHVVIVLANDKIIEHA